MNSAETAAACRICAHRQNSRSGVRNIPPPVPVNPERNPRPAPTLMAVGRDGGRRVAGSLRRKIKRNAEKKSTRPIKILKTEADGCKGPPKKEAGNQSKANRQNNFQTQA